MMPGRPPQRLSRVGESDSPKVVALGGGHGLAVSLRALRRVTDRLTGVVSMADNGGSSGRLRRGLGVPPPGDLRMALAALCGDDVWGQTWAGVLQHRFPAGDVAGHAVGNLLITALWEKTGDIVTSLDWVGALLGAHGRVLPVSREGLEIVADVLDLPGHPGVSELRGQAQVASTTGKVVGLRLEPADPPACPEAITAILDADALVMGPGSWYTSVIANLLVPQISAAFVGASGKKILLLNLVAQTGETAGFSPESHLRVLAQMFPELRFDVVVADPAHVGEPSELVRQCGRLGAELVLREVEDPLLEPGHHHPERLAATFAELLGRGRISAWQ